MAVYEEIRNLVQYGVNTGLLQESDRIYATNQILESWDWMNMKNRRAHAGRFHWKRRWMPCLIMHMRRAF